ncbi:hypothetical protein EG328_005990 [Venturia inaequalis]|uniref:Uncharacterized protein n=1 Tax=Venturia inaequalis TaxID=5025 RepID=A0A8H3UHW4_VENIN|nr:hypothetical protein EG328_005990 [Venturia inaequalis]
MPTPAPQKIKVTKTQHTKDAARRSNSRNTTPMSTSSVSRDAEPILSPYLQTSLSQHATLSNSPVDDIFDGSSSSSNPPSAATLRGITESLRTQLLSIIKPRSEICDRLMRELSGKRKERTERTRQRDIEMAEQEAANARRKEVIVAVTPKKRSHDAATSSSISSPVSQPPRSPTLGAQEQPAKNNAASPDSDAEDPHQPAPAPAVPQFQIFGEDPSEYPDPTVYEILDITPDMDEEQKKEILCVAGYPESDLHDLTAGTPPDKDFSNAKPTNQVGFVTFQNYVEPFIRPLTEEERAFLGERGDRERPFVIPKLGAKPYKEIWAEEDDAVVPNINSNRLPTNEPRGDVAELDDQMAETDEVSTGPLTSRLLTTLRPELWRTNGKDTGATLGGIDDMDIDEEPNGHAAPEPPATAFPEQNWKNLPQPAKADYASLDDRLLQEVKWLGLLPPNEQPDHASSMDDEVTARLRYLQSELKRQSIINGARKERLIGLTEDWQAKQEYSTIADDTDNQINAAYLKRNRNISKKGKQVKRPGGAGGGSHAVGVARPGSAVPSVGEPIRSLMERRKKWREWLGPIVDNGKSKIPTETIFPEALMKNYMVQEQEMFSEEREF